MGPWLETFAVLLVAACGILLARRLARCSRPWWGFWYLLPLGIIALMLAVRVREQWAFAGALAWLVTGRLRYVLVALAVTLGLVMPLSHLPRRWERIATGVFMVAVVAWFSVLPFLLPAVIRHQLAALQTTLTADGVCLQSTDYTCGPAAAVTALARLGISADEGQLAIHARANPVTGTLPAHLSAVLQRLYGDRGLRCRYQRFDSVAQLAQAGPTLAVLRDGRLRDHCVAILAVSDETVTLADPALGRISLGRQQFAAQWRHRAIVLELTQAGAGTFFPQSSL
ncbi:MAG TPA: hypothetical protein ENN81_03470 [Phycisphaerales bacterium]|nr:hypothetical protein [Phycisphaerales bacterium]